jgi:FtsP/CotA-like multicopper oxidase with cupredoxin domain
MPTRREMLKLGLMGGTAALLSRNEFVPKAWAQSLPPSPPTRPFVVPLPIMPVAVSKPQLLPAPGLDPVWGEAQRAPHQLWQEYFPKKFYEIHQMEALRSFHPDLPTQPVWGYNGITPGPTFHVRNGEPVLVRFHNDLRPDHVGFGKPWTSIHQHSGHTASESDGFPDDFFFPGLFKDYHYPLFNAGLSTSLPSGDPNEAVGTCWYHDHCLDFTSQNVYRGLVGCFFVFDDVDTGNELTGLRLPGGEFDVPLVFVDPRFTPAGQLFFDPFNNLGHLGDKFAVNGAIQPVMKVFRRKYRFRLVDGGPSRFYQFFLSTSSTSSSNEPFVRISSDAHLLEHAFQTDNVLIGVGERADIIVDFSHYPKGTQLFLQNRLEQPDPRGPTYKLLTPGAQLLRFDVGDLPPTPDKSISIGALLQPGFTLRRTPAINLNDVVATRKFVFDRGQGVWTVNGQIYNSKAVATPKQGSAEVWILKNNGGGWSHPIHIHMEEFRIMTRNGQAPPPEEQSMKDVFRLGPNDELQIFMRFRDFLGKYPTHCHNIVHEDHAMMFRWDVVA